MRNIEIKAKVASLKNLLEKAKSLAVSEPTVLKQHDTFYNVPAGRLKLRREEGSYGMLIFYDRPDTEGPSLSSFEIARIESENTTDINSVLTLSLGAKRDLKKVRHLFMVGQTRVHVDEVENLGSFMELEVCLRPEQTPEEGQQIAYNLMEKLGIQKEDLISGAYADLLETSS